VCVSSETSKSALMASIGQHQGKCIPYPVPGTTDCVIADQVTAQIAMWMKQGAFDIVRPEWYRAVVFSLVFNHSMYTHTGSMNASSSLGLLILNRVG
jgi:hypothetical protein